MTIDEIFGKGPDRTVFFNSAGTAILCIGVDELIDFTGCAMVRKIASGLRSRQMIGDPGSGS
jgi:hypothetical protein